MRKEEPIRIIVDTREQRPYAFVRYNCEPQVGTVKYGDYTVLGLEDLVAVERKSLDDFVGSICQERKRFEKEIASASSERKFFAVVIEAHPIHVRDHQYTSSMNPASVLQTAVSWAMKYGVHFIWAGSRASGEYHTFSILEKFARLHSAGHGDSGVENTGHQP